jgi:hypothetical protein
MDGMPAAEIFSEKRFMVSGNPQTWQHYKLPLSDNYVLFPSDGMVTMQAGSGSKPWQNGDIEVTFLETGIYTHENTDSCRLDYRLRVDAIAIPFEMDFPILQFGNRYVRGQGRVLAMRYDGSPAANKAVTISTRCKEDGLLEQTISGISTDSKGILRTPSLKQPQVRRETITEVIDSTHYRISGLTSGYVGHSVFFYGASGLLVNERTVTEHDAGIVTINAPPINGDLPAADQPIYIQLDYLHTVGVYGLGETDIECRNHGWSLGFMRLGTEIHGPVYNPLDPNHMPCFVPIAEGGGDMPEYI